MILRAAPSRKFSRGYTMLELLSVLILLMGIVVPLVSDVPFLLSVGVAFVIVAALYLLVMLTSGRSRAAHVRRVQDTVGALEPAQREALVKTMMEETGQSAEEVEAILDDFLKANPYSGGGDKGGDGAS
jgi:Ca2+/Na+ antiporter